MKQFIKSYMLCISMLILFVGCMLCSQQANAKTYKSQDNYYGSDCSAVISKGKVYYSIAQTGSIYCYDIKTKKTKTIIHSKGNRFCGLKKKGNYLYAAYESCNSYDGSNLSIVRVSIKNGKMKRLAKGCNFVLAGNKIYYTKTKRIKSPDGDFDQKVGTYSMTISGKKQKRVKNVVINDYREVQESIKNSKGTLFAKGESETDWYQAKSLHFTAKNGKTVEIYDVNKSNNPNRELNYFSLNGDYIVYKRYVKDGLGKEIGQIVLVKTNGKGERILYAKESGPVW